MNRAQFRRHREIDALRTALAEADAELNAELHSDSFNDPGAKELAVDAAAERCRMAADALAKVEQAAYRDAMAGKQGRK